MRLHMQLSAVLQVSKMPMCQAFGCTNHTSSHPKRSFFSIPNPSTDRERCARWINNIGTDKFVIKTYKYSKYRVVCEEHFEPECFQVDMRAKVMGYEPKRKLLKPDAVPTIFVHRPKAVQRRGTKRRFEESERNANRMQVLQGIFPKYQASTSTHVSEEPHDADVSDVRDSPAMLSFSDMSDIEVPEPCQFIEVSTEMGLIQSTKRLEDSARRKKRRRRHSAKQKCRDAVTQTLPGIGLADGSSQTEQEFFDFSGQCPESEDVTPSDIEHHYAMDTQLLNRPNSSMLQGEPEKHRATNPTIIINPLPAVQPVDVLPSGKSTEEPDSSTSSNEATRLPLHHDKAKSPIVSQLPSSPEKSSSSSTQQQSTSSYLPSYSSSSSDDEADEVPATFSMLCVQQRKYMVFEDNLEELFSIIKCPECGGPIDEKTKSTLGSFLRVKMYCINGHLVKNWTTQPLVNQTPAGNLLCSAATLFSGNTEKSLRVFHEYLGMEYISKSTFYEHQSKYLLPVINCTYLNEQKSLLEKCGRDVEVVGDGRCDSPGYCAKYCTYSMMDRSTHKILASELVQVSQATSSVAMEKVGFEKCMETLLEFNVKPSLIATDRHIGIRALIRKKYPDICHQFDVWHLAKSVKKKLFEASKKKAAQDLAPWIQSTSNHLWWCADSCGGDADLLVEKWTSLTYHITDQHEWQSEHEFHQCSHLPLEDDDRRTKDWIQNGSTAHQVLNDIIFNQQLLKDIRFLTHACHTGELEVYHGSLLKYCPKRQEFDFLQMQARNQLAVLDHNCNIGNRSQAVVQRERAGTGKKGTLRYKIVWSKSTKRWVLKKIYEDRTYDYIYDMLQKVIDLKLGNAEFRRPFLPDLPKNIAPIPAPSKEELLEALESRFPQ